MFLSFFWAYATQGLHIYRGTRSSRSRGTRDNGQVNKANVNDQGPLIA